MNNVVKQKEFIWVGAGISARYPTNLPLGNLLSKYYLEYILGDEYEEVINKYSKLYSLLLNIEIKEKVPRIELLFQIIKEMGENRLSTIEKTIDIFGKSQFNSNHINLAILFRYGLTIFTTNFDLCIEEAYESIFDEVLIFNIEANTYSNTHNNAKIIHCHGVYTNIKSLGINLDNVTTLNTYVEKELIDLLLGPNKLYMLGYSLSDDLDINNLFRNVNQNLKRCSILFINHNSEKVMNLDISRKQILDYGFINVVEEVHDSSKFLDELRKEYVYNYKNNYDFCNSFNFLEELTLFKESIDVNIFKAMILEHMGIKLDGIILKKYLNNDYAKKFINRVFKTRDVEFNEKDFRKAIDGLEKVVKDGVKIDSWMDLNRFSWEFYKKGVIHELSLFDFECINKILSCFIEYENLNLNSYKGNMSIKRNKGILMCLLGDNYLALKVLFEVRQEYIEIGNLDGVLGVYIDLYYCYVYNELKGSKFDNSENVENIIEEALMVGVQNKHKENYDFFKKQLQKFKKNN